MRDHPFVRSANPRFGEAFGGACAAERDGITCGWPESVHPPAPPAELARRLNGPMVARLRRCAADTSTDWDRRITIYPPEAQQLVALIDATLTQPVGVRPALDAAIERALPTAGGRVRPLLQQLQAELAQVDRLRHAGLGLPCGPCAGPCTIDQGTTDTRKKS